MPKRNDDDDVGYKKPPRKYQWGKGQSGNPGGREKGHKGLKTDLEATLNAVQTLENKLTGKKTKARNQLHAVQRLVERSALGDLKAQALLWPMLLNVLGAEDRNKGPKRIDPHDAEILAELLGAHFEAPADVTPLLTDDRAADVAGEDGAPADDDLDCDEDEDGDDAE